MTDATDARGAGVPAAAAGGGAAGGMHAGMGMRAGVVTRSVSESAKPTLAYIDVSSSASTESFPSDTSCGDDTEEDDIEADEFMAESPSPSTSGEFTEVRECVCV